MDTTTLRHIARLLLPPALLLTSACGGKLAHQHEADVHVGAPAPTEVLALVVEVDFGSITVLGSPSADAVTFEGTSLRAADTKEGLAAMQAVELTLQAVRAGEVLTLRATPLPAGIDPQTARQVIRGIVRCPDRLRLTVRTGLGHIKADGIAAAVDVESGQGEIAVKGCRGAVRAQTGKGDVMVDRHAGDVDLAAPGGAVRAYVKEFGVAGVTISAKSTAEVYLPRNAGFELTAASTGGRCHNSFGIPVSFDGNGAMTGRAGAGGPPVRMRATAGPVTCGVID